MYIIITGKVSVYYPKESYKTIKNDDRNHQRLVSISSQEAKALRTQALLKDANKGWENM